jgi:hypothetical protein
VAVVELWAAVGDNAAAIDDSVAAGLETADPLAGDTDWARLPAA